MLATRFMPGVTNGGSIPWAATTTLTHETSAHNRSGCNRSGNPDGATWNIS
ncbi:MAG: hypothetical protein RLZZ505_1877 [Verrucomicrobiota bacterium]|jgi:hypothetical protein